MSDQNKYAIIGMFAIVVVLYALRDSHTHYLPDLFGLALALAAPNQVYGIAAVSILAIVRHSWLAHGLAAGVPAWLLPIVLPGARTMSISGEESAAAEAAYKARISEENANDEVVEIQQPVAENRDELIAFGETMALARLVAKERIKLTEAVQIGAAAKSGPKYQQRSKAVKAAVEELRNRYPPNSNLKRFE